jgi:low temperature requirement protein LtrA
VDTRFTPLRPGGARYRAVLVLAGPVLWLVGLIAVAYVASRGDEIALALEIAAASFCVALLLVVPARIRRVKRESRT